LVVGVFYHVVALVADVIAERAGAYAQGTIRVRLEPTERTLWMHVGPLAPGGAQALLSEAPDVGPIIVKLADEVQIDADGPGPEFLRVCLAYEG